MLLDLDNNAGTHYHSLPNNNSLPYHHPLHNYHSQTYNDSAHLCECGLPETIGYQAQRCKIGVQGWRECGGRGMSLEILLFGANDNSSPHHHSLPNNNSLSYHYSLPNHHSQTYDHSSHLCFHCLPQADGYEGNCRQDCVPLW